MLPFISRALSLAAALACAGAAAAQSPLEPTLPPPGSGLEASQATPPRAVASVSLAPRAARWADAWDRNAHR